MGKLPTSTGAGFQPSTVSLFPPTKIWDPQALRDSLAHEVPPLKAKPLQPSVNRGAGIRNGVDWWVGDGMENPMQFWNFE